jgi:hypothetical protein
MKAIKIDVVKKDVYEVDVTTNIATFYKHLECDDFNQVGRRLPNGDCLIVDGEGLLKPAIGAFEFGTYPNALAGHGLLFGTDAGGETVGVKSTIEFVKAAVRFVDPARLPEPGFTIFKIK